MAIPEKVCRALRTMVELWSADHRFGSTFNYTEKDLQQKDFKKGVKMWELTHRYYSVRDKHNMDVWILFSQPGDKLCMDTVKAVVAECKQVDHVVFIRSKESNYITDFLDKSLPLWEKLSYDDLSFNLFKSGMVPLYEPLLTGDKKWAALQFLNVTNPEEAHKHVPRMIHREDAVARVLGLRPGDMVRVTKGDTMTGYNTSFRLISKKS